jgi:hypothetical protein
LLITFLLIIDKNPNYIKIFIYSIITLLEYKSTLNENE